MPTHIPPWMQAIETKRDEGITLHTPQAERVTLPGSN